MQMRAPLTDILVVDLTRHLPGPYAARMLANLGARVIKVEEPVLGDPVRHAPPFSAGRSRLAESLLSGIESVALDLRKEGGSAVLRDLLSRADVLLETFRPGRLASFGFSPDDLRATHPRLVICSLSGWGQCGPGAGRAGHDLTYQAAAGALCAANRPPSLPSADMLGAWTAVAAVSSALFERERRGAGAVIDASLFDAAVAGNVTNIAESARRTDVDAKELAIGSLTGALPCYRLYGARDGRLVAVAALEKKFWRSFCHAAGRDDLVALQYRRDQASHRRVAELFAARTAEEWQEIFVEHDVPGEIVADALGALASPQASARGLDALAGGGVPFPALIDGSRPAAGSAFPRVGEHTRAVLAEFSPRWLERSRRARVASGVGPLPSFERLARSWVDRLRT